MPQIDQIAEIYASQLFWLIITFGLIYFVIGRMMLPKIGSTVEARDRKIADDLEAAERAREAADRTEEAYRAGAEASRAEALKVTQAAKDASARETEARIKASDAELNEKTEAAEARLRERSDAAMAEIESVAAEAAREMVARLSGVTVTEAEAASAAKAALSSKVAAHG